MLDPDIKTQLKEVFQKLDRDVVLWLDASPHPDQGQLEAMLRDLGEGSSRIRVEASGQVSAVPHFRLEGAEGRRSVGFRGIPGAHEFSSLVLAILHANHKGKIPDAGLRARIQALRGPIRLKTYIALTCETCPDIVQALNLMALFHADFEHEMVDGAYVPEEVEALGLQGVPSVMHDGKLLHSGRTTLSDLLGLLEKHFGSITSTKGESELGHFDVVVVGGGPAGASAAIYSARKGLKTALIAERFGGQVQDTKGIENLISVVYTEGPQLAAELQKHVAAYPIQVYEHRRVARVEKGDAKRLTLESGETLLTEALIIATGAKWRELNIPGEKDYVGRGVAFCPHCDGPYYKGKKVAVVGGGNSGVEAAIDLAGIVREVVLVEFLETLKADRVLVDKLKTLPNVSIVTHAKCEKILGDGQKVYALEYAERSTGKVQRLDLDGVFVQIGLLPNSGFIRDVVETTRFGEIVVDAKGRSSEAGIYAAGDVTTTPYKQIIIAMGEGAKVALAAFEDRMKKPNAN